MLAAFVYARGFRRVRTQLPAWRMAAFFAGLAAILIALVSPVDALAEELFSVHMVQHMLLMVVAAPLLELGTPVRPLLLGLPRGIRRIFVQPVAAARSAHWMLHGLRVPLVAAALYVGGLYVWHIPRIYDAAVESTGLHLLEHLWFLTAALLFWSVVIDPVPMRATLPYAARIPFLLLVGAAQNTILGGLLAFSTRLFYGHYTGRSAAFGLESVTDQRLGGAIMWVPGDLIFLAAASLAFFHWIALEEKTQRLRERIP
ncbi:MAG: hypothetical protein NVS9B6_19170 [Candidatus Limnocylindrales bacterium]